MRLTFKEDTHDYFVDGTAYPGVTDILRSVGISNFDDIPDWHCWICKYHHERKVSRFKHGSEDHEFFSEREYWMHRGKSVHAAVSQICKEIMGVGAFDWMYLDQAPEFAPYIIHFQNFVEDSGFQPLVTECSLFSPEWGVCGTADLIGLMQEVLTLLDVKLSGARPATRIQTVFYKHMVPWLADARNDLAIDYKYANVDHQRMGLTLLKEPKPRKAPRGYEIEWYDDDEDLRVAQSALTVVQWKQANGIEWRKAA